MKAVMEIQISGEVRRMGKAKCLTVTSNVSASVIINPT